MHRQAASVAVLVREEYNDCASASFGFVDQDEYD